MTLCSTEKALLKHFVGRDPSIEMMFLFFLIDRVKAIYSLVKEAVTRVSIIRFILFPERWEVVILQYYSKDRHLFRNYRTF